MDPSNWEQYDIDWPPFNVNNFNYLNIGIPPVVSKNYRQQYMNFWNNDLNEQLNGNTKTIQTSTEHSTFNNTTSYVRPLVPHVNYYLDKSTDNPIRQLQYLLHHTGPNRSDMYQTQSTIEIPKVYDAVSASPENTFVLGDNQIVVKADSTLNVLIAMIIIFLVINVIIITIYLVRRNYFKRNLKRKLDVLSLDGTTDDELKRSNKFNDGDESFILDIVRRKNEYVPVKRYHSPINGFLLTRHYSTSTVDTHTKVSDWITQEVNRQSPNFRSKSPSFSFGTSNFFFGKNKSDKISIGIDATPANRSDSILRQQPIELMKSKSFELNTTTTGMICQNMNDKFMENVDSRRNPPDCILQVDNNNEQDPAANDYTQAKAQTIQNGSVEQVTSFIDDIDVNVTSRDECDGAHFPLTPEETLQIIQMRNYPKVLPKYPNASSEYVSASSFKRRSMPSYQHLLNNYSRMPPVPPPRTSSTLDRKLLLRQQSSNASDPTPLRAVMAQQISDTASVIEEEPEITYNALHVGPLLPGSKENLYSTVNRKKNVSIENKSCIIEAQIEIPSIDDDEDSTQISENNSGNKIECVDENKKSSIPQLKSIMKRPLQRENSFDANNSTQNQIVNTPQVLSTSKIPVLSRLSTSGTSNTSSNSNSNSNSDSKSSDDSTNESIVELNKTATSIISSTETSSSEADTIKHIF